MRHGDPSMAKARERMAADGVTKVVLLPLQPQFSQLWPLVSSPTHFLEHLGQEEYQSGRSSPPWPPLLSSTLVT